MKTEKELNELMKVADLIGQIISNQDLLPVISPDSFIALKLLRNNYMQCIDTETRPPRRTLAEIIAMKRKALHEESIS